MKPKIDIPGAADRAAQSAYAAAGGVGNWWLACLPDHSLEAAARVLKELVGAVRAFDASAEDLWQHCVASAFDVYPWQRAAFPARAAMITFREVALIGWQALDAELDRLERKPRPQVMRA